MESRLIFITLFLGVIAVIIVMSLVNRKDEQQVCREVNIFIEGKEAFIDQGDISALISKIMEILSGSDYLIFL